MSSCFSFSFWNYILTANEHVRVNGSFSGGGRWVKAMSGALRVNDTLSSLDLTNQSIGNKGAKALARALRQNRTLTKLNLRSNGIRSRGIEVLVKALCENDTLVELDLRENMIGYAGLKALRDALEENRALTSVHLTSNNCVSECEKIRRTIESLLHRNRTIRDCVMASVQALRAIGKTRRTRETVQQRYGGKPVPREVLYMIAKALFATRSDTAWVEASHGMRASKKRRTMKRFIL